MKSILGFEGKGVIYLLNLPLLEEWALLKLRQEHKPPQLSASLLLLVMGKQ